MGCLLKQSRLSPTLATFSLLLAEVDFLFPSFFSFLCLFSVYFPLSFSPYLFTTFLLLLEEVDILLSLFLFFLFFSVYFINSNFFSLFSIVLTTFLLLLDEVDILILLSFSIFFVFFSATKLFHALITVNIVFAQRFLLLIFDIYVSFRIQGCDKDNSPDERYQQIFRGDNILKNDIEI